MTIYLIRWNPANAYVREIRCSRPYTTKPEEAKAWKTEAAAKRWLAGRDPSYAASCEVVPFPCSVGEVRK